MTNITNWLSYNKIQYVKSVDNWKESIQIAGEQLLQDGSISQQYIDTIIRLKEEIGPYFVIAPQIAMPHARPEQGALKLSLSIVVLGNPVVFDSKENDPVKSIYMFSAPNSHSHIQMISQLAEFFSNEALIHSVLNVQSTEELRNILLK